MPSGPERGHVVARRLLQDGHPHLISSSKICGRAFERKKRGGREQRFCLLPLRQRQPSFDLSKPVLATEKCTQNKGSVASVYIPLPNCSVSVPSRCPCPRCRGDQPSQISNRCGRRAVNDDAKANELELLHAPRSFFRTAES